MNDREWKKKKIYGVSVLCFFNWMLVFSMIIPKRRELIYRGRQTNPKTMKDVDSESVGYLLFLALWMVVN